MSPSEERLLWLIATVLLLACIAIFPNQTEKVANAIGPSVARILAAVALIVFVVWWVRFLLGLFGL